MITTRIASVALLIFSTSSLAVAQQPEPPKVTVLQPGVNRLTEDLDFLVSKLANEPKAWSGKVFPNLQVFFPGIDLDRPIRFDVILDPTAEKEQYRSSFPVNPGNDKTFLRQNIKPLGINFVQIQRDFYKLGGAYVGFMRFEEVKPKQGYANFAEDQKLIPKGYDPLQGVNLKDFDAEDWIVGFKNDPKDQAAMADRAKGMTTLQKNLMAGIVKKKEETEEEFKLRKIAAEHQLIEMQRFFVESESVDASWNTDIKAIEGTGKLKLTAIPGTDLEKNLKAQASTPSRFAVMAVDPKISSALRVNFTLDEMRIGHLSEFYDALRGPMAQAIPKSTRWDDGQKEAANTLGNKFLDMLKSSLSLKTVDGFYNAEQAGNVFEVVGGFVVSEPDLMKQMVEGYPKLEKNATVTMKSDEVAGIEIHKIEVTKEVSPAFVTLFGEKAVVYIGTGKDTVWFSVGEKTLDRLKDAITKVSEAQPAEADGHMLYYHAHLLPVMKAVHAQSKDKDRENFRKQLIAGLETGDDHVELTLDQKDGAIIGFTKVHAGFLAAIGKMIAEFANTNL